MVMKKDCIFCKIIKGEIPSHKVYEDKSFLVFLDIRPVNPGHLLIVPKKHIIWMQEANNKTIKEIFCLAKKMMLLLKKKLKCDFVSVSVVGNEVPHFHVHLIPRYNKKDKFKEYPSKEYKAKEAEKILTLLKTK